MQAAPFTHAPKDLARLAFAAGQETILGGQRAVLPASAPARSTTGGWVLAMIDPQTKEPTLTDARTQDTILAALAFYRDNQLAYGAVPGQLSAQECTALIAQLSPQEEDHP
jgi:hypothetical protein